MKLSDNLIGILLMTAAMAGFAAEDAIIKILSATIGTGQILITIGIGGTIIFAILTRLRGEVFRRAEIFHPVLMARTVSEIIGTLCFVSALALSPISIVSAIVQANPLLVCLGAALFLGERVGPRRWVAIILGLIGVLIILRPGSAGIDLGSVLAALGVVGLSARDILTRRLPQGISTYVASTVGFAAVIPAGLFLYFLGQEITSPTSGQWGMFALAIAIGVLAYYAITAAMRVGEVGAVTPFRYSRLLFGVSLGIVVFGETLDWPTILGSALVVGAGLYVILREAYLRRV